MKQVLVVAIIFCSFCALANTEEVKRLSLDDAPSIGLRIQTDSLEKVEGRASIRITTLWPTSVCLGEMTGLDVEQAKLVFKAMVKSNMKGSVFLEMWVHFKDGQYFSRGLNDQVKDISGWTHLQTSFLLKKGQVPEKITLNLVINGTGTVWIDDIIIMKERLAS
jgi:hypothetical protein